MNPGFLKSKYVVYVISTQPRGLQAEHRYSDFVSLRDQLQRLYPGYVVPPLPKKKIGKKLDAIFLNKRKIKLQQFLNDLLKHPMLRATELFFQFLTLPAKDWDAKVKELIKAPGPKDPKECRTLDKVAKVEVTKASEAYCVEMFGDIATLKGQYKEYYHHPHQIRLRLINKAIVGQLEKLSESMDKASAVYAKICSVYSSLNEKGLANVFANLGESHQRLHQLYDMGKDNFRESFVSFNQFYQRELDAMGELAASQKTAREQLQAFEVKLRKKKEVKFELKNTSSWELDPACGVSSDTLFKNKAVAFQEMFANETKEASRMRLVCGYFTNKLTEEFVRVSKKNYEDMRPHFVTASSKCAGEAGAVPCSDIILGVDSGRVGAAGRSDS